MNVVKTYDHVNKEDDSISFSISKMETIYANRKGLVDTAHRHNYFTVLLIRDAAGKHIIDFNDYPLAKNQVFCISPGQVHQVIEDKQSTGFVMVFSTTFLAENNIPIRFIEDLNLFNDFGDTPPLTLDDEAVLTIHTYAKDIFTLHHSNITFKYEAIGALLKLILIHCNNACNKADDISQALDSKNSILSQFKTLINLHYKDWHNTKTYASALNITPDYLNRVVKSQTGKTAKEHIQSRITVAAKRLLHFTDLSNKEIGYALGFSEPGNFSAFFKHCVGISPSKFKVTN